MDFGVVVDLKQTYLILELTKCEVHCESQAFQTYIASIYICVTSATD